MLFQCDFVLRSLLMFSWKTCVFLEDLRRKGSELCTTALARSPVSALSIEDDVALLEERRPTLRLLGTDALRIAGDGSEHGAMSPGDLASMKGDDDCGRGIIVQRGRGFRSEKRRWR